MPYKLVITRENGVVSSEFQDPKSHWKKEFDITTVIGDYLSAKHKQTGKMGRPQTYYRLNGHIFDEVWAGQTRHG